MKTFAALILVLAACGDNNNSAGPDAAPSIDGKMIDAAPAASMAVAVGTDYDGSPPGMLASLNLDTKAVVKNTTIATDDPLIKKAGDKVVVINRDTNNVTILKNDLSLVTQIGTGAGSNPQDVVIAGNKVYVPSLGTAGVVVGHLDSTPNTTIDLNTATGSTDGKPDCVGAYLVGTDLYVTCDVLTSSAPTGPGQLVVIDTTTDTVRTHIALPKPNPAPYIVAHGNDLLVATYNMFVGSTSTPTGCIIKITPGATPTATCMLANTELGSGGGGVNSLAVAGDTLWISYSDLSFAHAWARSYSFTTSTLAATNLTADALTVHDVVACPDGKIVITEGAFGVAGGFRVYEGTSEVTPADLPFDLSPASSNGLICY